MISVLPKILLLIVFLGECKPQNNAVLAASLPHDYYECPDPTQAVTLAFSRTVQKEGKWFSTIEETINFPEVGVGTKPITCVFIKDLQANGKGGYATTVSGHVGGYSITVLLKSQLGQGLYFSVAIYTA